MQALLKLPYGSCKQFRKYVRRFLRKENLIFRGRYNVYKIVPHSSRIPSMERESRAAKIHQDPRFIYYGLGVFYRPILKCESVGALYQARRIPRTPSNEEIEILAQTLLDRTPAACHRAVWCETFDSHKFEAVWACMSEKQKKITNCLLGNLRIPVTGAHGDLAKNNIMVEDTGEIKIIDWEYFRERGSVVTDILYLYCSLHIRKSSEKIYNPFLIKKYGMPLFFGNNVFSENENPSLDALSLLGGFSAVCKTWVCRPEESHDKIIKDFVKYDFDFFSTCYE